MSTTGRYYSGSGQAIELAFRVDSEGNAHTLEQGVIGGERNVASLINSFMDVRSVGSGTMLTASMTTVAVGDSLAAGDTHVMRLIVTAATLGGTVTINGFQDVAGNAVALTFAAAVPFGVYDLGHVLNVKGQLTVTTAAGLTANSAMLVTRPA